MRQLLYFGCIKTKLFKALIGINFVFQVQFSLATQADRTLNYIDKDDRPIDLPCTLHGYKPEPNPEPSWKNRQGMIIDQVFTYSEKNATYKTTYLYYNKKPERQFNGSYVCQNSEDESQRSIAHLIIRCIFQLITFVKLNFNEFFSTFFEFFQMNSGAE